MSTLGIRDHSGCGGVNGLEKSRSSCGESSGESSEAAAAVFQAKRWSSGLVVAVKLERKRTFKRGLKDENNSTW